MMNAQYFIKNNGMERMVIITRTHTQSKWRHGVCLHEARHAASAAIQRVNNIGVLL